MLVATRDPFHDGTHKPSSHRPASPPPQGGSGRFMGLLQMAGAVLAIPVGLAGAYTTYRANFSVETSCQNLRAGIIATLDKNVDAATRRMLVRRDVQSFEQSCADVDPDATAAFKSLLAVEKTAAAPARTEAPAAKEAVRKPEPRPAVAAKPPAAPPTATAVVQPSPAPVQRDEVATDASWLAAVRGALVDHEPEKPKAVQPVVEPAVTPAPAVPAPAHVLKAPAESHAVAVAPPVVSAPPLAEAPALPPATTVPAPAPVAAALEAKPDPDRPVPPGSIPGPPPLSLEPKQAETGRSRFGDLIADIPLLGRVIDPKGN